MSVGKIELVGVKLPASLISWVEEFIEKDRELCYESVEKFVAEAVRKHILRWYGLKPRSETNGKKTVTIEISKEIYDFLKEYCEWSGEDFNDFINRELITDLESVLDCVRGETIPKGNEFFKRIQELKRKWLNDEL
jgi:hypothetical protein